MRKINIPSFSFLLPKEKIIRAIQELYWYLSDMSKLVSDNASEINKLMDKEYVDNTNVNAIETITFNNTPAVIDSTTKNATISYTPPITGIEVNGATVTPVNNVVDITIPAAQVQSNWNETNTSSKAYIQNKPTIPEAYSLPTASADTLGGIKVGTNLTITDGVLSADAASYENKAAASGGTDVSLCTTGEKYIWNNKQDAVANVVTGSGTSYTIWSGTEAQYNALGTYSNSTLYFITES